LARQATLRGKQVAVLPAGAYGRYKDVKEAWGALSLRTSLMLGRSASPSGLPMVTSSPQTPHVWPGRGSRGAQRPREPPTSGRTAHTPDSLDGPPAHHRAGCVLMIGQYQ